MTIDGQDLRDVSLNSLREQLGLVPQDTILFDEDVLYNLRCDGMRWDGKRYDNPQTYHILFYMIISYPIPSPSYPRHFSQESSNFSGRSGACANQVAKH